MRVPACTALDRTPRCDASQGRGNSESLTLWRLLGRLGELVCAVRFTTYGYAFTLALGDEPILLQLETSLEELVDKAAGLECALLRQGWIALSDD